MPRFVPLNSRKHRNMRFTPVTDFKFALQISEIDVTLSEVWTLSGFFPIVFTHRHKNSQDIFTPTVVIGASNQGNKLVCQEGSIKLSAVPSLLRIYPFLIKGSNEEEAQIFVDESSPYFCKSGCFPIFSEDGNYTTEAQNLMALFTLLAKGLREAQELGFVASRVGLLKPVRDTTARNKYFYVDLNCLNRLPDRSALMLNDRKWLQLFYAIAISSVHYLNGSQSSSVTYNQHS